MAFTKSQQVPMNSAPLHCGESASVCFFLHDGRTSDLLQAIEEHSSAFSKDDNCQGPQ
jgi:hypothetical protein